MCCRFPFIAAEIFTCEIEMILKTLVEDEEVDFFSVSFSVSPRFILRKGLKM